ncbi:unnamed protein product [Heterosigma akashiwo]
MAKGLRSKSKRRFRAERRKAYGDAAVEERLKKSQDVLQASIDAQEGTSMLALKGVLNPAGSSSSLPQEIANDALKAKQATENATSQRRAPTSSMEVENTGNKKVKIPPKKKVQKRKRGLKKKMVKF